VGVLHMKIVEIPHPVHLLRLHGDRAWSITCGQTNIQYYSARECPELENVCNIVAEQEALRIKKITEDT